jgi:hypothetical protein
MYSLALCFFDVAGQQSGHLVARPRGGHAPGSTGEAAQSGVVAIMLGVGRAATPDSPPLAVEIFGPTFQICQT